MLSSFPNKETQNLHQLQKPQNTKTHIPKIPPKNSPQTWKPKTTKNNLPHTTPLESHNRIPPNKRHPYVMKLLGHRNIKNTLIYTQLITQEENEEYISKVATTIKEGRTLIEAGFEYVCEIQGVQLFKKRK